MKTQPVIARIALGTLVLTLGCVHTVFGEIAQVPSHTNAQAFGSYACVQRGPHSKVWQMATLQTNASGIVRTNFESYTEVATGLCYLQNGQYMDSVEEIDSAPEGAQATQGRYQVHWMANANTPTGAVSLTTPDGKQLHSTVYGLAYTDTSSGSNVMLAQLQDCTGVIVDPNVVLYTNAFSNLTADIRYTYRKAGMSQDIILKQQPPSPADYGFNPATTRLQVVTEFFNAPEPSRTTITNSQGADNRSLNFGNMKMGVGHAFLFKTAGGTEPGGAVIKHWKTLENRTFLIEEIPYAAISNILSTLHSSSMRPDKA